MDEEILRKIDLLIQLLPESMRNDVRGFVEKGDLDGLVDYTCRKFNISRELMLRIVDKLEKRMVKDKNKVDELIKRIKFMWWNL